jgi:hypothetical protein
MARPLYKQGAREGFRDARLHHSRASRAPFFRIINVGTVAFHPFRLYTKLT